MMNFVENPFQGFELLVKGFATGQERPGHQYIRRTGAPGHWQYFYQEGQGEEGVEAKPDIPKEGVEWNKEIIPKELITHVASQYKQVKPEHAHKINAAIQAFTGGTDSMSQHMANNEWTPERKQLHDKIKKTYMDLGEQAKPKGDKPKVIFMAGLPAAGKTYATQSMFSKVEGSNGKLLQDKDGEKYVVLNADDIKEMLPEFDGGLGAPLVHRESSKLNAALVDHFTKAGVNIVLDGTLAKMDKAKEQLLHLKNRNYDSHLIHVDAPVKSALTRAHDRYVKEGRFVPYDMLASYDAPIKKTINEIKGHFDHFTHIPKD